MRVLLSLLAAVLPGLGQWFARHGYAAFLLDTVEFGEIPGIIFRLHGANDSIRQAASLAEALKVWKQ